jgi:FKBP-type peptidyl-prolyl cis-trans isomerase FkpA
MQVMIKNFLFLVLVTFMAFAACKKDNIDYPARDKQIIVDYLKAKGLTASSTSSGLYYIIEDSGNYKKRPGTLTSSINVGYKGYLTNDTVFNDTVTSSWFTLTSTIKGWQEGIKLVGVGGKIKLIVPSDLGYGSTATGKIPKHAVLVFNIGLIDYY